jgi:hypothetical protein
MEVPFTVHNIDRSTSSGPAHTQNLSPSASPLEKLREFFDFSALPFEELCSLFASGRVEHRCSGEVVLQSGDSDRQQMYLLRGAVTLIAHDGREHRIESESENARWPVSRLRPCLYTLIAAEPIEYFMIDGDVLRPLCAKNQSRRAQNFCFDVL